jgi:predicted DNA-binding transcriptional regulator AlpA
MSINMDESVWPTDAGPVTAKLDGYLTKQQLAQLLHVTPRTVNNYVSAGQLPAPIHVGRLALWSKSSLATFLAALQVQP